MTKARWFANPNAYGSMPASRVEFLLNGLAGQFAESVRSDPAGRARGYGCYLFCGLDGGLVEPGVALAHLPQGPVDGFLDVIALVGGLALDDLEIGQEIGI